MKKTWVCFEVLKMNGAEQFELFDLYMYLFIL